MSESKKFETLYLCYFGLREPLVQTQVLPYLREIKKIDGLEISLLTFEPNLKETWTAGQIEEEKQKLAAVGIEWRCLPYHKWPSVPATLYDVLRGILFTRKMIRRKGLDIIHTRSYVPMFMAAAAAKLGRGEKPKIIFDIRGFFPEEYTDAGNWKANGRLYKTVKKIEKWLLRKADGFVVLTEKARDILFRESRETGFDKFGRPVEVIPCCVDMARFESANEISRREIRGEQGWNGRRVIVYIGSLGTWYLADEMADLMQAARDTDPKTFALILTQSAPEIMSERLAARGFTGQDLLVKKVPQSEVPKYLSASDIALSFIKPCFSKLSSSPTKIAEYLASGIPIITNSGVGDTAEQIETDKTGAVVDDFTRQSYLRALEKIDELKRSPDLADNCRRSARARFDLQKIGGVKYRQLYEILLGKIK